MDVAVALRGGQGWCWLHGSGAETRAGDAVHQEQGVPASDVYIKLIQCLLAVRQAFVSADSLSLP